MIYLDHASTSWPKPDEVREQVVCALTKLTANAGRSGHSPSVDSARLVFETRERLAELLGVGQSENLIFTRGCTEGLNLVLNGWLKHGDRVGVSPMEHNALMRPLTRLAREREIAVEILPADHYGRIDLDAANRRPAEKKPFALLAVAHAANVNGVVQDLPGLRQAFPETPILVDSAQTAGVLPINVQQMGISFLAFSMHKGLLGPTGVGACYLAPGLDVVPLVEGGTGSHSESLEQPATRPDRYEAGTLNLHGIAGTYGAMLGISQRALLGDAKRQLTTALIEQLAKIPRVVIHSPTDGSALCVALTISGIPPDRVSARLEQECGVLCRPGLHCAPLAHQHLGTAPSGTVRLSPGWKNSMDDVETAVRGIHAIATSG